MNKAETEFKRAAKIRLLVILHNFWCGPAHKHIRKVEEANFKLNCFTSVSIAQAHTYVK